MKTPDIQTFCNQLHTALQQQLRDITAQPHEWTQLSQALQVTAATVRQLRSFTCAYTFQNSAEEIKFFKHSKPNLVAEYLFRQQLVQLKCEEPLGNPDALTSYYRQQLIQLQQEDKAHASFYLYCLSGNTDRDEEYFLRTATPSDPLSDERFTTGYDMLYAQWRAHEMLRDHLTATIHKGNADTTSPLAWTAPKVALIELLYALHACLVFNHGKTDVRHIATALETTFNINLGNYYRTLLEIRLRKNNRTTFLDQLKEKFIQRLDDMD